MVNNHECYSIGGYPGVQSWGVCHPDRDISINSDTVTAVSCIIKPKKIYHNGACILEEILDTVLTGNWDLC